MRNFVLVALVALLAAAAGLFYWRYQSVSTEMKATEQASNARYAETINAIVEIQDSLSAIALGDTTVKMLSQNLQTEQSVSGSTNHDALDRVAEIRGSIMRSKERIRRLEADLKHRGIKIAGMQKMIAGLRASVAEKEVLVAQLTGTVDSLNTQVTGLTGEVQQVRTTLAEREQTIEERRKELATVYYLAAPKKQLISSGAIIAKGGILGLGSTLQPSRHIVDSFLKTLDTDQQTVLELPTPKAQVLSAQPSSGYELKLVDGKLELHILEPREFRKVRQLIIMTA
jgi:uncharacterized coiled-coil protein SlyX